jgi:ribosomal protein L23
MNNPGSIIKNPRITEKATIVAEGACYTFDVAKNATKKAPGSKIKYISLVKSYDDCI